MIYTIEQDTPSPGLKKISPEKFEKVKMRDLKFKFQHKKTTLYGQLLFSYFFIPHFLAISSGIASL